MSDVSVFHQNTNKLSTIASARGGAYKTVFEKLRQTLGRRYMVCGLTELFGNPPGLARLVPDLTKYLDGKLDRVVIIAIGETSYPRTVEYIGIAYDHTFFNLRAAGSVLRKASSAGWVIYNKLSANITRDKRENGSIGMPPAELGYKADFRGLAYILTETNAGHYLFGFIHNDYKDIGDRSSTFRSLAYAAELIASQANINPADIKVIFGGDFNLDPANIKGGSIEMTARFAQDNNGPINTTAANVYDFWLLTDNIDVNDCLTHDQTRDRGRGLSDHNGITFGFDYP